AQLISLCLKPQPGDRVLDACAAPGGKTTHLAALIGDLGEITAVDRDPRRLAQVAESCRRLGLISVRTVPLDWEHPPEAEITGLPAEGFDKVLLDAPCSGLGVLRRHPEGKWGKSAPLIGRMAALQRRLLARIAQYVKPGGVLLYATCSTEEEENDAVIRDFLSLHPEFRPEDLRGFLPPSCHPLLTPEGRLKTYPALADMDGFYAARLRRHPR
ncbi:MAG: RsmB/NOP family class I SAM-dependent RNA methyltransferase, partial [Nitrospirae bacterium]|nr:RsmB/NOP family class I SAM-dependent RNA methyltransferase [Nitrospirota bacterium]